MTRWIVLVGALALASPVSAMRWPLTNGNQQHAVTGTVGEYRATGSPHFHDGVDITTAPTSQGPNIFSVSDGTIVNLVRNGNSNDFIAVRSGQQVFIYFHMTPDAGLSKNDSVSAGDFLGDIASFTPAHLHFKQTDLFNTQILNSLLSPTGGLSPYSDAAPTSVSSTTFFDGASAVGGNSISISSPVANAYLRIRAKASDAQSLGSSNVGIFSIGYQVVNNDTGATVINKPIQQSYQGILGLIVNIPDIAYDTTVSNNSNYYYFPNDQVAVVTPVDLRNLPDATYRICVIANDLKGNGGSECKTYRLDRTAPDSGLRNGNGASLFDGGASSMTIITVTSTDTFGLKQIAISGPTSDSRNVTGLTATETFTGLSDGQYTAVVTDLALNQRSMSFIIGRDQFLVEGRV
jgi:hypothetical protein